MAGPETGYGPDPCVETAARPTPISNIREAEEQCKRTEELLARFENHLQEMGVYLSQPNTVRDEMAKVHPPENLSLADTAERVNRHTRINANRLGDLLDQLQVALI